MFKKNVVCLSVRHLVGENLLVYCPGERLINKILEICDSLHQVGVFGIVRVDNTDEMFFSQAFEEVKHLLDHLEVVLLVMRDCREQTRKTVNID